MAGNLFYLLMLVSIGLSMWLSTQQLVLGVLTVDYGAICFYDMLPAQGMWALALANVFAFAIAYFWRPFTPNLTS
jgi:hypothetical protein